MDRAMQSCTVGFSILSVDIDKGGQKTGQVRRWAKSDKILFMSWVPHRNQSWVYGAKKLFSPNDLKFCTLVYLLIRNDF